MKDNLSDKHEELYAAMDIEYRYFVLHEEPIALSKIINNALELFPKSINVKRATQPFYLHQSIIAKEEDFPEDC